MKACKKIKKLLVAYVSEELESSENEFIEKHLEKCSGCKKEFDSISIFVNETELLKEQNENIIREIDWRKNRLLEQNKFSLYHPSRNKFRFFPAVSWKALVPVLVSVFVFGILAGYFLFNPKVDDNPVSFNLANQNQSVDRIRTTLARKEILEYFRQIQLLLLDVVKQCDYGSAPVLTGELDRVQVRQLLVKNRYLSQDMNEPQLMSTRSILKNIELLLYEILTITEKNSCRDIRRLQNIIQQERILLKIRLIEKDLSAYEV
jgi:hypothetical protein